jgi:hypothetical protein
VRGLTQLGHLCSQMMLALEVEAIIDYHVAWASRTTGQGSSSGKRLCKGLTHGEH